MTAALTGMTVQSTAVAQGSATRQAMEFVPGDTEIYEQGKRGEFDARSRVSGVSRVSGDTPLRQAQRLAIRAWEQQVRKEHGPGYARWLKAKGRVVTCDPPGSSAYSCRASAIPIR